MILRVDPDVLLWICKRPGTTTSGTPIPRDARVVNRQVDQRGDILLLVESEEFPETPEGQQYPEMTGPSFTSPDHEARSLVVQAIARLEQLGDLDLAVKLADHFEVKVAEEDEAKASEAQRLADPLTIARNASINHGPMA